MLTKKLLTSILYHYLAFYLELVPSASAAVMVPREPDPEDSARAEKQKPARRIRTKQSRSDVFKNSEDNVMKLRRRNTRAQENVSVVL